MSDKKIGSTQNFVLAQGFRQAGEYQALTAGEGGARLLAEITADPDRPEVRVGEAYQALLASMQPGWSIRFLQIFWPDPLPRQEFQRQAASWERARSDGLELLRQGLLLGIEQAPLPFIRRTILEYALPGDEGLSWWSGLGGLFQAYSLRFRPLNASEIRELAAWVFNPDLSDHG